MTESTSGPTALGLDEAARVLKMPTEGVQALVGAGYLNATGRDEGEPTFALGDLKAFLARLSVETSELLSHDILAEFDPVDPQALLDALDGRSPEMARRAFDIFTQVFPEAATWEIREQQRFIEQATDRFEAILSVTSMGEDLDVALMADLEDIGAAAARAGSPLPQLLVILRISRDLVVQTAVEVAEERGRHWGLALSLVLTRVLPAIDRLTDALAQGYWAAVVGREEEVRARYESVVEQSNDGIFEVDPDGRISYANEALATILGLERDDIVGTELTELFGAGEASDLYDVLRSEAPQGAGTSLRIGRPDEGERVVEIRAFSREESGEVIGRQGIVHDVTAVADLEARKNEFFRSVTEELRQPLTTILGLGVTLAAYADELPVPRLRRIGRTIHLHAERLTRLTDDLYDLSSLESHDLVVHLRPCRLSEVVEAACSMLGEEPTALEVAVDPTIEIVADRRRVERAVATIIEHAITVGPPPVKIASALHDDVADLTVEHRGRTVEQMPGSSLRPGLGLPLAENLVGAMGGTVTIEELGGRGTRVRLAFPLA
jgi:PAS domain S-box-containing protein